jgi:hypothetical protein
MRMLRISPKKPSCLPDRLLHHLDLYTIAAGAAGVSLLALAPPAEAEIVYTKANQQVGANGTYSLDLDHDGVVDFLIQQWPGALASSGFAALYAKAALGNGVQGAGAALSAGQEIGPGQVFTSRGLYGEAMAFVERTSTFSKIYSGGAWLNVRNRYLGLKFQVNGKTHYGWARLSVKVTRANQTVVALLTGYAYETVPNQGLKAGQISADTSALPLTEGATGMQVAEPKTLDSSLLTAERNSDSLANLALGADGLRLRRKQ